MNNVDNPNSFMFKRFEERTAAHINRVRHFIDLCLNNLPLGFLDDDEKGELIERAKYHDASKYSDAERIPYVWLTEYHYCKNNGKKFDYPPGVESKVREATFHHITNNRHHPEFFDDVNDMSKVDVIEMVCDWAAMAAELNEGSPRTFANNNVGVRWNFDDDHINLVFHIIDCIESC